MRSEPATAVHAAGAVLWRPSVKHHIKVALIHRPRYDDWSLPKGKAITQESLPMTAAREVREETGFTVTLGRRLTSVCYQVPAGLKRVQYFVARPLSGEFVASREVDRLRWLTVHDARRLLVHKFDRAVLDAFALQRPDPSGVLLVRHAHAGQRESFAGNDDDRPLDSKGQRQALALAAELPVFVPSAVHSAPGLRCRQSVQPLADALGFTIVDQPLLAEDAYRDNPAGARRLVTDLALVPEGPIVACSQGGVIPGVVKSLAALADIALRDASTPKGAYWHLFFDGKQLLQADRYAAPGI